VTARTMQGMARVRSGQAPAWPLVSDRSVRRGSGVKRDFACTFTRYSSPALVVLRSESRLRPEGRTRTLSGPSPDLTLEPVSGSRSVATRPYPHLVHILSTSAAPCHGFPQRRVLTLWMFRQPIASSYDAFIQAGSAGV
jgi:hypothetical protein